MANTVRERMDLFFVRPRSKTGDLAKKAESPATVVIRAPDGRRAHLLDRDVYESALRVAIKRMQG